MRLEFKRVTDMSAAESAAHDALRAIVYPSAPGAPPPVVPYDWVPPEWRALVWEDAGALVSTTGALVRRVRVDGRPTTIGGIGSVKTHPAVEGKGYASAGLRQAMAFLNGEVQVAFHCSSAARRSCRFTDDAAGPCSAEPSSPSEQGVEPSRLRSTP